MPDVLLDIGSLALFRCISMMFMLQNCEMPPRKFSLIGGPLFAVGHAFAADESSLSGK